MGTVCSGIGAPELAWTSIEGGFEFVFNAEIEAFPSAVLQHHFPKVPNFGDMRKFKEWPDYEGEERIDILVGGTPCQAFSVAGLRKGLADPRGNLTLIFLGIIAKYRPEWVVWENVPGVLSDKTGAFGAFLGGLGELGYGFAYRILDAQYHGVAQRRRRVFVVGHIGGEWQRAAAVLFERESLCGNHPPRREAREELTYSVAPSLGASGRGTERTGETRGQDPVVAVIAIQERAVSENLENGPQGKGYQFDVGYTLEARNKVQAVCPIGGGEVGCALRAEASHSGDKDGGGVNCTMVAEVAPTLGRCAQKTPDFNLDGGLIAHALKGEGFDASEDGTGRGVPLVPEVSGTLNAGAYSGAYNGQDAYNDLLMPEVCSSVTSKGSGGPSGDECQNMVPVVEDAEKSRAIAYRSGNCGEGDKTAALNTGTDQNQNILIFKMAVRRLTPRECERLQGFPDNYTLIHYHGKPSADGPRYKALGNSMCAGFRPRLGVMRWIGERILLVQGIS